VAKRILSTVVLWLLLLGGLAVFRTPGAVVMVVLLSVLTLREFYALMAACGFAPFGRLGMMFGALITAAPWTEARFGPAAHVLLPLATVVFAIRILGERPPERRVEALSATIFGLVYVALQLQYLVRIITPLASDRIEADGRLLLGIWVIAVAKFCDVGALLSGMAFGRHALAPQISPKKTWEGAAGGVLSSMLVGALVAWLGRGVVPVSFTPLRASLLAAPVAAVAIVSDLIESVIKRRASLKDSGRAIPGIGGIFDVSDSLLLAAPVAYYLLGLP
jgi:phosphatidate cytidylyltransferase